MYFVLFSLSNLNEWFLVKIIWQSNFSIKLIYIRLKTVSDIIIIASSYFDNSILIFINSSIFIIIFVIFFGCFLYLSYFIYWNNYWRTILILIFSKTTSIMRWWSFLFRIIEMIVLLFLFLIFRKTLSKKFWTFI